MLSFLRKLIFLDKARDKILALLNEVLDLARVESGGLYLKQEPVEVCSFIEECISLARTQADKLDIQRIHASMPDEILHADHVRLKQIILNLISNAVKCNRKSIKVHVELRRSDIQVTKIIVTDTGIGIAPHKMGVFFVSSYLSRELQIIKSDSDLMYFPFIPHAVLSTMY